MILIFACVHFLHNILGFYFSIFHVLAVIETCSLCFRLCLDFGHFLFDCFLLD